MAAEAGRLRSVAMARAEIIFDIGDSIVERAFDGSHLIARRNAVGCAATTITECHFSALGPRSPPTRFLRVWNTAGLDEKGAIVLREKVSRGRIAARLVNVPQCLIGIEAGMATHYVARKLLALGQEVKQVLAAPGRR